MIYIGELKRRITIQSPVTAQEQTFGQEVTNSYTTFATRWAKIEYLDSTEEEKAKQIKPKTTVKITIRYFADITSDMRVVNGTNTWNIKGITHDEERTFTMLTCVGRK